MNIEHISKQFLNRVPNPEGKYKNFSVLIPLIYVEGEIHLLFEIRSQNLNTQPGEICFPGGGIEEDESSMECAIRETAEELNVDPLKIDLLGQSDFIVTPFNLILYPFVGILKDTFFDKIDYNRDEVESLFTVPLKYFLETPPDTYYVSTSLDMPKAFPYEKIQNGRVYNWRTGKYPILFYDYKGYVIWGMTARIIQSFINVLNSSI